MAPLFYGTVAPSLDNQMNMSSRISSLLEGQQGSTMQFRLGQHSTPARKTFSMYSLTTRHFAAHPSRSCTAMLLSLMLLAGLAGCGPTSSDNAPSFESRASVGGPAARGAGQAEKGSKPLAASGIETGFVSGKNRVPGGDNIGQEDKLSKPAGTANVESDGRDKLPVPGIPESIAKALDSPDARVRLQALDHWEKKGSKVPLDPLFEALEDENDAVRAKATAIIEQQWAIERERG